MFILRKITGNGSEANQFLGLHYNFIHFERHRVDFLKTMELWSPEGLDESIYAFIIHNNGSEVIPLYRAHLNYVMMGDGSTFSNLTYK